jgi:hypothetical protein
MRAHSTRSVAARRGVTLALTVLAVSGWGAFAYASWSAARTERALQSQITRLNTDRNGVAPARKQQGQEAAATRTVYPAPYGTSAPHTGEGCPFGALADSSFHVLRAALASRNGASGSRTSGRTTDGLGHTCLASAFDFFWAAHDYRASDAGRARDQADGQHHSRGECPEACRHQHGLG